MTDAPLGWMIDPFFTSWSYSSSGQFQAKTPVLYLRTTFIGLDAMAAYEYQFFYKEGIVAYLNGEEIYRDNLPKGILHPSVEPNNLYSIADYHKVIRVDNDVKEGENHFAVALYFQSSPSSPSSTSIKGIVNREVDDRSISILSGLTKGMELQKKEDEKEEAKIHTHRQHFSLHPSLNFLQSNEYITYFCRVASYASSLPTTSDNDIYYPVIPPSTLVGYMALLHTSLISIWIPPLPSPK